MHHDPPCTTTIHHAPPQSTTIHLAHPQYNRAHPRRNYQRLTRHRLKHKIHATHRHTGSFVEQTGNKKDLVREDKNELVYRSCVCIASKPDLASFATRAPIIDPL
ncbi:hypothetical protein T492DRAFT_1017721 [Pavlovales sp. CCMP2436]|nr:hypothetical protein T492DRAFT_1017721 [Pavlovales sp. CCMP2436]